MDRRTRPTFPRCFACGRLHTAAATERHHFPVPRRHGGTSTVPLCQTCHDLAERIPIGDWPDGWAERGVRELLSTLPVLLVIWSHTTTARAILTGQGWADPLRDAGTCLGLPTRLRQVAPRSILGRIDGLGRCGRLFVLKMLPGLFDDEPGRASAWASIRFELVTQPGGRTIGLETADRPAEWLRLRIVGRGR